MVKIFLLDPEEGDFNTVSMSEEVEVENITRETEANIMIPVASTSGEF